MEYMTDNVEPMTTAGKMYVYKFFINSELLFLIIKPSLCCQCGVLIESNALNMCNGCMQTQIDITELIPKQGQLQMCNKCIRYIKSILFLINYSGISRSQKIGGGNRRFFRISAEKTKFPKIGRK
jgi:hypothetical protein